MAGLIEAGQTVLFQGDSITDAGRSREDDAQLGGGYAMMIAAWYQGLYPREGVRFLNRGISGNRVSDLRARWNGDCIDLSPDWVSVMIGINDTWRAFDSDNPTSTGDYQADYRAILRDVRERTPARLILLEPFVLPYPEDRRQWRVDLDPRIHVVRELATEFGALLVPVDGMMAAAAAGREPGFFAADGVHPTPAGHALIAQAWLRTVQVAQLSV